MRTLIICLLSFLLFTPLPGHALAFNADTVATFIDTLTQMREISAKHGAPEDIGNMSDLNEQMARAQAPFSRAVESMQNYAGYKEMTRVIADKGFSDVNQWAAFGDRVMRAYGAIKLATEAPKVDAQMAQAMKELENSGLSDAQKKMMMEVMGSANKVMDSFKDVPESDRAAVKPHLQRLEGM